MKLTVMVPVFNEVNTIMQAIKDIEKISVIDKEVLVVDNCSTDGTKELLKNFDNVHSYRIVFNEKNILGGSFVICFNLAKGEYIYVHHSDLEYDPSDANEMLKVAEQGGYDLVLGSRLKNIREPMWKIVINRPSYLASILCTYLINKWYKKNFTDIIGSRLYRTSTIKKIPIPNLGIAWDFEHVSRICKRGLKVAEVAVSYKPRSYKEGKKIRPRHIINAIIAMFRVRIFG